jgi:hypothetical protein
LLVEDDHPPLALVAFVAVIEAIGKELDPPVRKYFERFRRALRLDVVSLLDRGMTGSSRRGDRVVAAAT